MPTPARSLGLRGEGLCCLFGLFLGYLLAARDGGLGADAPEHESHAEDLHVRQTVAEGDDR